MYSPIGFILGSGWGKITSRLRDKKEISFEKAFGQKTGVPGHKGEVVSGTIEGKEVIILSGRFHTYEGFNSHEASKTVRYLHSQGVRKIVVTSAAGGLNSKYKVGDLVILTDIISLFCQSPLTGPQFQDLSSPFSEKLVKAAQIAAKATKVPYVRGIYAYMKGPHFESFADKKALKILVVGYQSCLRQARS